MAELSPTVLAKLAALRAGKSTPVAPQIPTTPEVSNAPVNPEPVKDPADSSNVVVSNSSVGAVVSNNIASSVPSTVENKQSSRVKITLGTERTTEIDHLEFLSKMNQLQEAIHTQHPQMPQLLRVIHKQLLADPELVTLLNEEAIGIVVKGLEIQTKTELVSVVLKESKTKAKKIPLDTDMF